MRRERVSYSSSMCVKSSTDGKRTNGISFLSFFPLFFFCLVFLSVGCLRGCEKKYDAVIMLRSKRMRGGVGAYGGCGARWQELSTKKVILNPKALSPKIKSKVVGGSGGRGGHRTI